MSSGGPSKCASGNTKQNAADNGQRLSSDNIRTANLTNTDKSASPSKNGNGSRAALEPSPTPPNQLSPTKSTPTKSSKNKKKNEARRRSAQSKKQMAPSAANNVTDNNIKDDQNITKSEMVTVTKQTNDQKIMTQEIRPEESPSTQGGQHIATDVVTNTGDSSAEVSPQHPKPTPAKAQQESQVTTSQQPRGTATEANSGNINKAPHDTNSWRRKQRENKELRDQLKLRDSQLETLVDRTKQQISRIRELEASLVSTTRACKQFEQLLQQEVSKRTKLEFENEGLHQTVTRLKNQICVHEKDKSTNSELIRVLNATLMERETEISILKLKMTRMQTNPACNLPLNLANSSSSVRQQDPCKTYASTGRSNSEFCRNSYIRSSMMAEAASATSSTTQLNDRNASVWAAVPEELTPSRRPIMLERNLQSIYGESSPYGTPNYEALASNQPPAALSRDRRYKTMPKSMKSPSGEFANMKSDETSLPSRQTLETQPGPSGTSAALRQQQQQHQPTYCLVTNLDDSNSTSHSSGNRNSSDIANVSELKPMAASSLAESSDQRQHVDLADNKSIAKQSSLSNNPAKDEQNNSSIKRVPNTRDESHYSTISNSNLEPRRGSATQVTVAGGGSERPGLPERSPSTPVKISLGLKKIFGKFRRTDSATSESQSKSDLRTSQPEAQETKTSSAFQRGSVRSTIMGPSSGVRAQLTPVRKAMDFKTDKPFAEWNIDMIVDWLTTIGLSMYANQCRRSFKCGAHIMDATPAEVDKGLGITNHLHRKKLRLAISELNGDCDKITKAAAKLDYLWVARWLDDIGLPQHKEAFINGRVDGRVLNYLTVEDLVSMGVKSVLHHSSIRCGIRVLRSINFDLQLLKRRATAEEIEQMNSMRQILDQETDDEVGLKKSSLEAAKRVGDENANLPLWTCHRVMEWLRMIDFAEFAPNLRGSGVHGGLIFYEDAFNIDTICSLLSIPTNRTLLRRHLSTFFKELIGEELELRKRNYKDLSSNQQLNPLAEIKIHKKSQIWFGKLKSSKVSQDGTDEYLCPMYPVEPQLMKSPLKIKTDSPHRSSLPRIPESINV